MRTALLGRNKIRLSKMRRKKAVGGGVGKRGHAEKNKKKIFAKKALKAAMGDSDLKAPHSY